MKFTKLACAVVAGLGLVASSYSEDKQPASAPAQESAIIGFDNKNLELQDVFSNAEESSWTKDQFKALQSSVEKENGRFLSTNKKKSVQADPAKISPYMVKFRERLLAAKTGEDMAELFENLETDYKAFADNKAAFNDVANADFRYFYARVAPTRQMGGIAWRMVPAVEKIRASQEILVGVLRSMAEQVMIHSPGTHHEALFRYLTEPQKGKLTRFNNENDIQTFFVKEISPELQKSISSIKSLMDLVAKQPIVYDSRLRFGEASFPDKNEKQYRLIGGAELASVLARLHRRLAGIQTFVAYDFRGYLYLRDQISYQQGMAIANAPLMDLFAGKPEIGDLTRQGRVAIMRSVTKKSEYANFGKIVAAGKWGKFTNGKPYFSGEQLMRLAYNNLYQSAQFLKIANEALEKRDEKYENSDWLLDPAVFVQRDELNDVAVDSLVALTEAGDYKNNANDKGQRGVKSALSGEVVQVNLKAYFLNPPKNLVDMMPTKFEQGPKELSDKSFCRNCSYRNYFLGRATAWNPTAYSQIFPGTNGADISHKMDILTESRGGRVAANLLMPFVR